MKKKEKKELGKDIFCEMESLIEKYKRKNFLRA